MTYQNWIELLVPVIGIIIAVVSASLTYYFSKKKQILSDECRLKEKYYLKFIDAISYAAVSNNSEESRDQLADAQNQLLLVANANVVSKLMIFNDYIKLSNTDFDLEKHDELLTDLIKSMRKDLYRKTKANNGYPLIHLTGKAPKK